MLQSINIKRFRNIVDSTLSISPHITLLVGANGQGKTNALEAMFLLLHGKSFRSSKESDLVMDSQGLAEITANGSHHDQSVYWSHRIRLAPPSRSHTGLLIPTIIFSPDDLRMIKDGPSFRRAYLDGLISGISPRYRKALKDYQKILVNRNRSIKDPAYRNLLDTYTPLLIKNGYYIWQERYRIFQALTPVVHQIYHEIAPDDAISWSYSFGGIGSKPIQSLDEYATHIERRKLEELKRGMTLVGPHRDDIIININSRNATQFGSQGQQRSLALVLKLASFHMMYEETGIRPIVLLDDVLSELDSYRRDALMTIVRHADQQTIITDTEPRNYRNLSPAIYQVSQGVITPWDTRLLTK